jgi:hypothetical protein
VDPNQQTMGSMLFHPECCHGLSLAFAYSKIVLLMPFKFAEDFAFFDYTMTISEKMLAVLKVNPLSPYGWLETGKFLCFANW